jgi:hypothetical protein
MKKIKFILNCVTNVIKKKIFKSQKTEICQECKKALNLDDEINSIEDLKLTEEYANNYNVTTRWQTV